MMSVIVKELKMKNIRRKHYGLMEMFFGIGCVFQFKGMEVCKSQIENKVYVRSMGNGFCFKDEKLFKDLISLLDSFFAEKSEVSFFLDGTMPGEYPSTFLKDLRVRLPESFEISIDPIVIRNIQCRRKSVPITATIDFGDSLVAYNVPIYDMVSDTYLDLDFIKSIEIEHFVMSVLRKDEIMEQMRDVFQIGHEISSDFEFSNIDE